MTHGAQSWLAARPLGGRVGADGATFRVWAPERRQVEVQVIGPEAGPHPMERSPDGSWGLTLPLQAGATYKYRLDGGESFPDPFSLSQPEGVHGPSQLVDLGRHRWQDGGWPGLQPAGLVLYECHVGTATAQGTLDALIGRIGYLLELGVNAIELMPVAEFPGNRGWGYDAVYPFAVHHAYGGPLALCRFIDAAHQHGLAVVLDVIYNHLGPEGNYLGQFSRQYFTSRHKTPWGDALNYDGENSGWMRRLIVDNACQWVRDFHADGLRLDATSQIFDSSATHVLAELTAAAREAAGGRGIVLISETSENDPRYVRPLAAGGRGFDAIWADDFHHVVRRYLAGDSEGYYQDYEGSTEELARTIDQGFLYQGEMSKFSGKPRGAPAGDLPAASFQYCIQNHDQVGNRALGDRLTESTDLARYRAASTLLLLLPFTPLLFFGQEFAASSPFQFFTDFGPELGPLVTKGRRQEFADYASFASTDIPDPQAESTFSSSKVDYREAVRPPGAEVLALYKAALRLRKSDPVLRGQSRDGVRASAAGRDALAVQLGDQRLLAVNFGSSSARVRGRVASILFASNRKEFGGDGQAVVQDGEDILLPAATAVLVSLQAVV